MNERKEGNDMLAWATAKNAAKRLLMEKDIELKHFVDVQRVRRGASPG